MKRHLARLWDAVRFLGLTAGYLGLAFWLIDGQVERMGWMSLPVDFGVPLVLGFLVVLVLWSALPKWRRLEDRDEVLWTANLPSRIGSFVEAVIGPLFIFPSLGLVPEWVAGHDYPRLAGMAALSALTLWLIWQGLKAAWASRVSVKVSASGLQVLRDIFPWSDIQAIESGFATLEGGAAILLADRTVRLSPDKHGPTGRALVKAVERFSPGTPIREPSFQAAFGMAAG